MIEGQKRVKLKRLVVQGFKSFKDRSVIHFDDGITGIVGPNGCGKSNIVDALFWVMGEQSAKHLRGSSMKDLIFAGSSKYSPATWAEVTLILDNTESKHIHIGNKVSNPSEIQLSRKLYRNGETEYRINGVPCRLKDIQEVFMDTGAGAKSYSIIAQGEIDRLVKAKPDERRIMIEEVAGITKFKLRRKESIKKIEQTQANLARLDDLQQEIDKQLKLLEKQAEKAQRAKKLKEIIQKNELITSSHREYDYLKSIGEFNQKISNSMTQVQAWKMEKDSIDIGLEDERIRKDLQAEKIDELQSQYNQLSRELAAAEERSRSLERVIIDKEKLKTDKTKELAEITSDIEERSQKQEELLKELEQAKEFSSLEHDFSTQEEQVEILKEKLSIDEQEYREHKNKEEKLRIEIQNLTQEISINNSKLNDVSAQLEDNTTETEELEKHYSGFSTKVSDQRDRVHSLEEQLKSHEERELILKAKIHENETKLKDLEATYKMMGRKALEKEARFSSLEEIQKEFHISFSGTEQFLKTQQNENHFLLGHLIECDEQYVQPVQKLLATLLEVLVHNSGQPSEQILKWLQQNHSDSIQILTINDRLDSYQETLERLRIKGLDDVIELVDIVRINETNQFLRPLLKGQFISAKLNNMNCHQYLDLFGIRGLVSQDGSILIQNRDGQMLLTQHGQNNGEQGIVARNIEMTSLKIELDQFQQTLSKMEAEIEQEKLSFEILKNDYNENHKLLVSIKTEHASRSTALESQLSNHEQNSTRLEILKKRKIDLSKNRLEWLELEEKLINKKSILSNQIEQLNLDGDDSKERIELLRSQFEDLRSELLEKKAMARSIQDRMKSLEHQCLDMNRQLEKLDLRLQNGQESITQIEADLKQAHLDYEIICEDNKNKVNELTRQEDVLSILKDQLAQLLSDMQERENQIKKLGHQIAKTEKEITDSNVKLEKFLSEEAHNTRDIFEKYQIDLRTTLKRYLEWDCEQSSCLHDINSMYIQMTENGDSKIEVQEYEFNRKYGKELSEAEEKFKSAKSEYSRLGEINWQAIEDYEHQKVRHQFLRAQELELKQSIQDLQNAIDHIDKKSKERFRIAFEEVAERFQKVFPIIFGGGQARLQLIGSLDDPECGVDIMAQPPGKKGQNINLLSGGEKALTAVSLIFSIFLVKPSPFCLLDEVDAPLDDANVGRFNELLREMSHESQFILITHNKKTMELNDTLYGVTMQEPGISKCLSVQLH